MAELKEIMFEKGKDYPCLETLERDTIVYCIEGKNYHCSMNNCLTTEVGERFVEAIYLRHFFEGF